MIEANSNQQDRDRRKSPRIPMGVSILIPHLKLKLLCHNLSPKGCFFQVADLGSVGQTFSILIDLPEIGMIQIEVRVAHKGNDGKGSGLQFISMAPKDEIKLAYFLEIFES
ncbi:MAG: PilZ domain-containing protein [Deltaproteobacteria bacterium]|nr:PilZ domain-containing protein [Deltaproteobacteria bacterium]